jgi:hypothetical protein
VLHAVDHAVSARDRRNARLRAGEVLQLERGSDQPVLDALAQGVGVLVHEIPSDVLATTACYDFEIAKLVIFLMSLKSALHGRWAFICGGAVGVLIAFPLAAPVFDGKILEPVATMWGSALGAIAAVAGAIWIAERQVAQQRRSAAALVREMFHSTTFALDELAFVFGPPSRPHKGDSDDEPDVFNAEKWKEVADHAGLVLDHYKKFNSRIHRYEAGLNLLSANSLSTALALETELEDIIRDAVTRLKMHPQSYDPASGKVSYPEQAPTWSRRFALTVSNRHVQDYMAKLEREAS